MAATEYYLINTKEIVSYISWLDEINPSRTKSYIDLFLWNIQENLFRILWNSNQFMIEIDHDKKEISLSGDEIPTQPRHYFCENLDNKEALYQNFLLSVETMKKEWLYGIAITEIIPNKKES